MAPTAIALVPCAFAVVPFAKFQYKCKFFLIEVPVTLAVPLQEQNLQALDVSQVEIPVEPS